MNWFDIPLNFNCAVEDSAVGTFALKELAVSVIISSKVYFCLLEFPLLELGFVATAVMLGFLNSFSSSASTPCTNFDWRSVSNFA